MISKLPEYSYKRKIENQEKLELFVTLKICILFEALSYFNSTTSITLILLWKDYLTSSFRKMQTGFLVSGNDFFCNTIALNMQVVSLKNKIDLH